MSVDAKTYQEPQDWKLVSEEMYGDGWRLYVNKNREWLLGHDITETIPAESWHCETLPMLEIRVVEKCPEWMRKMVIDYARAVNEKLLDLKKMEKDIPISILHLQGG